MRDGCPNCENVLQLRGNNDAIQECTSQVFEGLISVRDPTASWVARWQRLDNYVPGTYATKVTGTVSSQRQPSWTAVADALVRYSFQNTSLAAWRILESNMSRTLLAGYVLLSIVCLGILEHLLTRFIDEMAVPAKRTHDPLIDGSLYLLPSPIKQAPPDDTLQK